MSPDATTETVEALLARVRAGQSDAAAELFELHREKLKRMIRLRVDRRVQSRLDASDVMQEVFVDVARRVREYAETRPMDFYVWLRFLTGQKLMELHRQHLGAQKRDANMEVSLYRRAMPDATSISLAAQLLGTVTAPLKAAARAEAQTQLQEALNAMDPMDREVLVLRHFEALTNSEVAQMLQIKPSTATMRYMRALEKLGQIIRSIPALKDHSFA